LEQPKKAQGSGPGSTAHATTTLGQVAWNRKRCRQASRLSHPSPHGHGDTRWGGAENSGRRGERRHRGGVRATRDRRWRPRCSQSDLTQARSRYARFAPHLTGQPPLPAALLSETRVPLAGVYALGVWDRHGGWLHGASILYL
jgi:hypothetical protein